MAKNHDRILFECLLALYHCLFTMYLQENLPNVPAENHMTSRIQVVPKARACHWRNCQVSTALFAFCAILFSMASTVRAVDEQPWQSLFNGADFAGWKVVALRDPAPAVIEEGAMMLRQSINTVEHTFVTTEKKYGDFILELEVKDDPEFNSGILLRCSDAPAEAAVRLNGYQVKIDNTKRAWTGGVFDDFGNGWKWLFDLKENAPGREAFKFKEWNQFRIECIGPKIKVWVNGVPTCNLIDEKYREGYIAFKIHSVGNNPKATESAIQFKNIRILSENPEKYAKPMALEARRASTGPGEYDKASP